MGIEDFKVGDVVVFPLGSAHEEERYNIYEGVVIRVRYFPFFKIYQVLYKENGHEKIIELYYNDIHLKKKIDDLKEFLKPSRI